MAILKYNMVLTIPGTYGYAWKESFNLARRITKCIYEKTCDYIRDNPYLPLEFKMQRFGDFEIMHLVLVDDEYTGTLVKLLNHQLKVYESIAFNTYPSATIIIEALLRANNNNVYEYVNFLITPSILGSKSGTAINLKFDENVDKFIVPKSLYKYNDCIHFRDNEIYIDYHKVLNTYFDEMTGMTTYR